MVKIAVLSDIHANWYSLECIINTREFKSCDKLIFCGDVVGYYYQAEQVINYLKANIDYGVKGNHDEKFQLFMEDNRTIKCNYTNRYGNGLKQTMDAVSNNNYKWVINLPETIEIIIEDKTIFICHGSPLKKNGYIYPDTSDEIIELIFGLNYDCVIMGHSHYQYVFKKNNQLVFNPGAVGQARDRGGYAGWAILNVNTDSVEVQLQKTKYDVSRLLIDVKRFDPNNEYLYRVLEK